MGSTLFFSTLNAQSNECQLDSRMINKTALDTIKTGVFYWPGIQQTTVVRVLTTERSSEIVD